jgi:predicted PolB exonuclease-like 3'-5' exonuclease
VNVFVFDIETVPDVDAGRRLLGLKDLDDEKVAQIMFNQSRARTGSEFLRHHLHRVIAISVVLRSGERFKVWSLGTAESDEKDLIKRFFDGLERYSPVLVSWNGGGFDLPVLHYRSLLHGVVAPRYWESGDDDSSFRYNNYLSRFHHRHTDLMDVLSAYQPRASAKLDDIATLLGFPGKLGMDGSKVWDNYVRGDIESIRNYCETDVLNTYLLYLRYQLIRGRLAEPAYQLECELVKSSLLEADRPQLHEFLAGWNPVAEPVV